MEMSVYSFKNKFLGVFSQPFYVEVGPENYSASMTRSILTSDDSKKTAKIAGCQLYYLGKFDDEKGLFDLLGDPKVLIDCDDVIARRKLLEVATNGTENK